MWSTPSFANYLSKKAVAKVVKKEPATGASDVVKRGVRPVVKKTAAVVEEKGIKIQVRQQ